MPQRARWKDGLFRVSRVTVIEFEHCQHAMHRYLSSRISLDNASNGRDQHVPRLRQNSHPSAIRWIANAGLLHQFQLSPAIAFVVTFLAFDLFIFAIHRVWHVVPWLWRIHAIHHSDVEFDTTTHYHHHPLEAVIGTGFQLGFV